MEVKDIHPKEALEHVISEFELHAKGKKTDITNIRVLKKTGQ